jgi:hypothetical protein
MLLPKDHKDKEVRALSMEELSSFPGRFRLGNFAPANVSVTLVNKQSISYNETNIKAVKFHTDTKLKAKV